jgi:hypothetical protein
MRITEIQVKVKKRKRDLIIVAMNQEDFDGMEGTVLMGEFHRGQVFIIKEEREQEFIEILKSEAK